jgi:transposase
MVKKSSGEASNPRLRKRRRYDDELRAEAVQMLLDGHSAASIVERLGISSATLLYHWKKQRIQKTGPVATSLEARVQELEAENLRLTRERDVLKKALIIFGRTS